MPRIYTMCLPPRYLHNIHDRSAASNATGASTSLGRSLIDLEATREEVVKEVSVCRLRK